MKKIILASGSVQRKKLLKQLGIKFTVRPSQAEEISKITSTCSALVKQNALIKAESVASKLKSGVVIGADTVVYIGNKKLILKPRDLKDAKRILKVLFSRPQWVYTGVVVIDVKSGKKVIDYEKTKVYMNRLTDKEIDRYHKKVPPLDKAGGFDIEGVGSVFIHRIEGCYTNVIGLPMAKLFQMLKKVGVSALSVLMAFGLTACSTEYNLATQQEERHFYSTDKEVNLGGRVAEKIEEQFDVVDDVDINEKVEEMLDRIVAVSDRKDIVYVIKVLDEDDVNAISLPGGYVYLFRGLVELAENDDQIAGVVAHEVAHITARHGVKRLQASYGALILQVAAMEAGVGGGANLALNSLFMEYSQKDEYQADELGVKYMKKAGYDPKEMVKFLALMKKEKDKQLRQYSYWKTHPNLSKRMAVVNKEIKGKMEFRDYLNIIQHDDPMP